MGSDGTIFLSPMGLVMVMNTRVVQVQIAGESLPIVSSESDTHLEQLATLVDQRMRQVAATNRRLARDKVALLAALSLASELVELKLQYGNPSDQLDHRLSELSHRLDLALADGPSSSVLADHAA